MIADLILHIRSEGGKKDSTALRFCVCVFMFQDIFCALSICDRSLGWGGGGVVKQCWKRPLFSFPLKAAFFSSPTHFFPEPVHFKSWPGPVCHVTCLPKGSFQINSSSPWDAYPPTLKAIQRHHLLIGGASQRKCTLLNQDCIHCHDIAAEWLFSMQLDNKVFSIQCTKMCWKLFKN